MTRVLSIAAFALLGGLPLPLAAQIATGFTPPAPRPTPAQVAATDSARVSARDSVVLAERLDMRAWVDSAARSLERGGAPVTPIEEVIGDSLARPAAPDSARARAARDSSRTPARPAPPRAARDTSRAPARTGRPPDEPSFREGAAAPDTATPLPLLLVLGGSLAGIGVGLLRRR